MPPGGSNEVTLPGLFTKIKTFFWVEMVNRQDSNRVLLLGAPT